MITAVAAAGMKGLRVAQVQAGAFVVVDAGWVIRGGMAVVANAGGPGSKPGMNGERAMAEYFSPPIGRFGRGVAMGMLAVLNGLKICCVNRKVQVA